MAGDELHTVPAPATVFAATLIKYWFFAADGVPWTNGVVCDATKGSHEADLRTLRCVLMAVGTCGALCGVCLASWRAKELPGLCIPHLPHFGAHTTINRGYEIKNFHSNCSFLFVNHVRVFCVALRI